MKGTAMLRYCVNIPANNNQSQSSFYTNSDEAAIWLATSFIKQGVNATVTQLIEQNIDVKQPA